ncbi:hypothetical protein [Rhodococcus spongiicola]|uniref:Uncharacterized protein n=1 Tax=Rhodococcus spongiicola TaxID=2487352 RepID=A0A438B5M7_9NOCA|nr:hypothetical protein [Rhodococcus spongiicola]RVW06251.1 hypothetical protein EF834_02000 [Rhodococcus spongiicola]
MTSIVDQGELMHVCLHPDTLMRSDCNGPFELCHDCHQVLDDHGPWDGSDRDEVTWRVLAWVSVITFIAAFALGLLCWWRLT